MFSHHPVIRLGVIIFAVILFFEIGLSCGSNSGDDDGRTSVGDSDDDGIDLPMDDDADDADDDECGALQDGGESWGSVTTENPANAELNYLIYIPAHNQCDVLPVLAPLGGLGSNSHDYVSGLYKDFADDNKFAIVSPAFVYDENDWNNQESYQYPAAWSGLALSNIIAEVAEDYPIDQDRVFLFGFSAGAQFAHRWALLYPARAVAAAVHAAGSFSYPEEYIDTRFLITVGSYDDDRIVWAQNFYEAADFLGIDVTLEIIEGISHRLVEEQVAMSIEYFLESL